MLLENRNISITKKQKKMKHYQILDMTVNAAIYDNGRQNGQKKDKQGDQSRMTSVEIAKVTGKLHKVVLAAIRNMEPAWTATTGQRFMLSEYLDGRGRLMPCYALTKTECLYVATKFNDEARARLVLRWEELEKERQQTQQTQQTRLPRELGSGLSLLCQVMTKQQDIINQQKQQLIQMAPKADYCDQVLQSRDCYTTTQVAKELSMTVWDLTKLLLSHGIVYFTSGQYMLYADFARKGYARSRTHIFYDRERTKHTKAYLVWTEEGRRFIHRVVENASRQKDEMTRARIIGLTDMEIIDRV